MTVALTVDRLLWGPGSKHRITGYADQIDLATATCSVGSYLIIPKDGAITHVGIYIYSVTTPYDYNIGLVTSDANYKPTTTAYGGSTNASFTPIAGWQWVALGGNATGAAGDKAFVRIWPGANTPDGTHKIRLQAGWTYDGDKLRYPHAVYSTDGSAWTDLSSLPIMAIKYDDGSVYPTAIADHNTAGFYTAINNGSNPREIGALFQVPMACKCIGARLSVMKYAASVGCTVSLYDASNTELATCFITPGRLADYSSYSLELNWDAVSLVADTNYRLIIKSAETSWDWRLNHVTLNEAASRSYFPEGGRWQYTYRASGGAWTNLTTKLPFMALILSEISYPSAGGGGSFAFLG